MPWSTRQLAELARTTVNTVRHYHSVGLLELPARTSNGYKQYTVPHLVRLLQIRRLVELGLSLDQIAAREQDDRGAGAELDALDAELTASIDRLVRARDELAQLRRHRAPADTPSGFAAVAEGLTEAQRSLLTVYASVFDEEALQEFRRAVAEPDPAEQELDRLPPDADDATVEALAGRLVAVVLRGREQHPHLDGAVTGSAHGAAAAASAMSEAIADVYHPAQLRVLRRLHELLADTDDPDRPADTVEAPGSERPRRG